MIKKWISQLWNSEDQNDIRAPKNVSASFSLWFKDLEVGILSVNDGHWKFIYSDEFKNQDVIKPLIDFPEINKEYETATLWPFFSYRIPGLNQPKVQKQIIEKKIDAKNQIELLKEFGNISVYNPFKLKYL